DVLLPCHKNVRSQGEVFQVVGERVFGAAPVAAYVVEWRIDWDECELTFVEIVAVDPEIVILRIGQMMRELMRETGVPRVIGFGKRRSVTARAGPDGSSRPREKLEDSRRNILKIGYLKASREPGMQGRIGARLVNEIDRGAELAVDGKTR